MTDAEVAELERLERRYHDATIAESRAYSKLILTEADYDRAYRQREDARAALRQYREQCKQAERV